MKDPMFDNAPIVSKRRIQNIGAWEPVLRHIEKIVLGQFGKDIMYILIHCLFLCCETLICYKSKSVRLLWLKSAEI